MALHFWAVEQENEAIRRAREGKDKGTPTDPAKEKKQYADFLRVEEQAKRLRQ